MKRQWLIIVLLLMAAALLRLQISMERTGQEGQDSQGQLTRLQPDEITTVRIQRPTGTLSLERNGDTWRMTQPEAAAANPERITELKALAILNVLGTYTVDPKDLKRYGLEPPQLTVWLNDSRLDFGLANPATQRRYVKVGDKLHLIADNIYPILLLPVDNFILADKDETGR